MKFVPILLVISLVSCSTKNEGHVNDTPEIDKQNTETTVGKSYKVIFTDEIGWGYQIFDGNKMMINQKHIPAIQGLQGFETKEQAEITAKYILDQIDSGNFPPTISTDILDSLGVI